MQTEGRTVRGSQECVAIARSLCVLDVVTNSEVSEGMRTRLTRKVVAVVVSAALVGKSIREKKRDAG
ncbi:hypothetical protein E2C01_023797 [Portunus trituberculatus]|uniref:Uncharacterized protein n=1 Tax=Portunus trituberculatus TaxID=210409 RepID=A0A5B7E8X8_PORTR|nr:hypothetical protein [Portunus trituberculatus]